MTMTLERYLSGLRYEMCPEMHFDPERCGWCLRKVFAEAIMAERERCAKIAEKRMSYSEPGETAFDKGWKRCAQRITEEIRENRE